MNISAIQALPPSQLTWVTVRAQEKECDFLSLRLLNKRTRMRLSTEPLDLSVHDGKGVYFAVSNIKSWFVAVAYTQSGHSLVFSPLSELRVSIVSSTTEGEDTFTPKRTLPLSAAPTHLAFGLNDERLAVGFADGSISLYDTSKLFLLGDYNVEPLHVFPPGLSGPLRQILGNPADLPDFIAVRREAEGSGDGLAVEIFDVRQLRSVGGWRKGGTAETVPTSIAWSTKGKQLAIGLRNGDIVTYSPSNTNAVKLHVPKPLSVGDCSVISIMWLSNQAFYGIYAPSGSARTPEAVQKHVLTYYDPKASSATQTELETPYYASPALRPPGAFTVVMRNWDPAKVLIFIGDSTSSDVGVIGSLAEDGASTEMWCNLSMEETSTPSVPLDKDAEDTVLLGLEMDLTFKKDSDHSYPPPPVLYLYASDGTLQAWNVFNEKGGSYPGMVMTSAEDLSTTTTQSVPDAKTAPAASAAPSTVTPSFGGSNGFGNLTPKFGQTSAPVLPTFGQTSTAAFGSSSFGQAASTTPALGQALAFGESSGISAFGSVTQSAFGQRSAAGFGAFASQTPPKFGATGFGFASPSPPAASPSITSAASPAADSAIPEAEMSESGDGESSGFGSLSLGGSEDSSKSQNGAVNSMFGAFAQKPTQEKSIPPAFGPSSGTLGGGSGTFGSAQGSSFIKPASGFGAFSKPTVPSPNTNTSLAEAKPSPAFGISGFALAKPQSAFEQPTFGQATFGVSSSFGKPSAFGAAIPASSTARPGTSSAFSTFAGTSKGFGTFAQGGHSSFLQQGQGIQSKLSEAPSIAMATSSDGGGSSTAQQEEIRAFGDASAQQVSTSSFGGPAPLNSSFSIKSQTSNVFGGSQFPSPGSHKSACSAFGTPVDRSQTPTSSPEGSPTFGSRSKPNVLTQGSPIDNSKKADTDSSSTVISSTPFETPSSSSFKGGAPVTTGTFANLTATSSTFKPAEGFGAFGAGAKVRSSSPFANPKTATVSAFSTPVKHLSAFGPDGSGFSSAFQTAFQTPGKNLSTTPKFGTPSAPGGLSVFGNSSFAMPATPSPASTVPTKPATSAFSAYSGSGGFTAFAKASEPSSFSDLLRSQKDGETQKAASSFVFGASSASAKSPDASKSTEKQKEKDEQEEEKETGNVSKDSAFSLKGELSFISITKPDEVDHDNLPPTPSTHGTFDEDDQDLGDEQGDYHDDAASFLSESFSEGSVGEDGEEEGEINEDDGDGEVCSSDDKELVSETPARSAIQSVFPLPSLSTLDSKDTTPKSTPIVQKPASSETPDTPGESSAASSLSGESGESSIKPPSPSVFTKPASSSETTTMVQSTLALSLNKPAPPSLLGSTMPLGSPAKLEASESVLAPKFAVPPTSSTSLSLSRPNSRPSRSSPLTGAPVSGDESKTTPGMQTSQPAPLLPKARPASPKKPFGQIPDVTIPPKPSTSTPPKKPGSQSQPSTSNAPPSSGSPTTPINPPQLGGLSPSPATPTPPSKIPTFGSSLSPLAGNAPFIMPSTTPAGTPVPTGSAFGLGPNVSQLPIGLASDKTVGSLSIQQGGRPPVQQPPVQTTFESGMQRECHILYLTMMEEFEQLKKTSQAAVAMRLALGRPSKSAHTREDLSDKTKWTFGDLEAFGKLVRSLEKDILAAYESKNEFTLLMREVESNLLKVETRKEEIVRFSKAKADPEFAKMLKARTLSPDAAETQSQLRKQIRLTNDRVEQLEAHLKACKRKLEEHRKGKPSMKPPALDTINRTYRNIDLAIETQAQRITDLTSRVAKLNVAALGAALRGDDM